MFTKYTLSVEFSWPENTILGRIDSPLTRRMAYGVQMETFFFAMPCTDNLVISMQLFCSLKDPTVCSQTAPNTMRRYFILVFEFFCTEDKPVVTACWEENCCCNTTLAATALWPHDALKENMSTGIGSNNTMPCILRCRYT